MNWMEFISAMTGALAWPAAVVFLAVVFRRQLSGLVGALDSWEGFGQKFTFRKDLTRAEKKVGQVVTSLSKKTAAASYPPSAADPWHDPYPPSAADPWHDPYPPSAYPSYPQGGAYPPSASYPGLSSPAEPDPSATILESWDQLVLSLQQLNAAAGGGGWTPAVVQDAEQVLADLRKGGAADHDLLQLAGELKELRDRVAHGSHRPTPGEAATYANAVSRLRVSVQSLATSLRLGRPTPRGSADSSPFGTPSPSPFDASQDPPAGTPPSGTGQ